MIKNINKKYRKQEGNKIIEILKPVQKKEILVKDVKETKNQKKQKPIEKIEEIENNSEENITKNE